MNRKKLITTIVALGISIVFLYIAFKGIDLRVLWETFRGINWVWMLPTVVLTYLSFWWRGWRWQKLLKPLKECGIMSLLGPTMIGFAFNNIFPARAGEIARPIALKKKENIPFTTGLSTVLLERMFDVLALLVLFILVLAFIRFPDDFIFRYKELEITPELIGSIAQKSLILAIIGFGGAIAMLMPAFRRLVIRIVNAMPLLPAKLKQWITHFFETFANGFDCLRSPWLVVQIVLHTMAVWGLTGLSIWTLGLGFPGFELTIFDTMIFLVITCMVVALPSAPGYWGVYEVGGQVAFVLAGVVANTEVGLAQAMGFTLLIHFVHFGVSTAMGLYYAARIHVSVSEVSQRAEQPIL